MNERNSLRPNDLLPIIFYACVSVTFFLFFIYFILSTNLKCSRQNVCIVNYVCYAVLGNAALADLVRVRQAHIMNRSSKIHFPSEYRSGRTTFDYVFVSHLTRSLAP